MLRYEKILILLLFSVFLTSCKTTPEPELEHQLNLDFSCYNICLDATKGMKLSQLEAFCKLQCQLGN